MEKKYPIGIEPNTSSHQDIIVKVCKAHGVKSLELTTKHIALMSDCISEYISQQRYFPPLPEPILTDEDVKDLSVKDGGLAQTTVFVPCLENDPRCCGGYTSNDGQGLAYVRESNVPVIEQGAVWVKGHYDRLYDRLKSGGDKRIVCFVDYDTRVKDYILRDICTVHPDTLEFTARGIGYGSVRHMQGDEKENFIGLCKMLNIEWLDESPAKDAVEQDLKDGKELTEFYRHIEEREKIAAVEALQSIQLTDMDAPIFTHTKEFAAHFSYIKGKFIELAGGINQSKGTADTAPDELWDEYSEVIDDDIDSLTTWAGSVVMTIEGFMKIIEKINQSNR